MWYPLFVDVLNFPEILPMFTIVLDPDVQPYVMLSRHFFLLS